MFSDTFCCPKPRSHFSLNGCLLYIPCVSRPPDPSDVSHPSNGGKDQAELEGVLFAGSPNLSGFVGFWHLCLVCSPSCHHPLELLPDHQATHTPSHHGNFFTIASPLLSLGPETTGAALVRRHLHSTGQTIPRLVNGRRESVSDPPGSSALPKLGVHPSPNLETGRQEVLGKLDTDTALVGKGMKTQEDGSEGKA